MNNRIRVNRNVFYRAQHEPFCAGLDEHREPVHAALKRLGSSKGIPRRESARAPYWLATGCALGWRHCGRTLMVITTIATVVVVVILVALIPATFLFLVPLAIIRTLEILAVAKLHVAFGEETRLATHRAFPPALTHVLSPDNHFLSGNQ